MEKEDLRVRRTRKLLLEALFDLMQTTPFDKISVSDICDRAMVHRATFYNHFKDKNDLLNFGLDEIQERMFESLTKDDGKSPNRDAYMDLVGKSIDFFNENKEKFALVISNGSEKLYSAIYEATQRSIRYMLSKNRGSRPYELPLEIVTNFLAGGICSVGAEQVTSKKPYPKAEMMTFFSKLFDLKRLAERKD